MTLNTDQLEREYWTGYERCKEKPKPNLQSQFIGYVPHNPKKSARPNFEVVA